MSTFTRYHYPGRLTPAPRPAISSIAGHPKPERVAELTKIGNTAQARKLAMTKCPKSGYGVAEVELSTMA